MDDIVDKLCDFAEIVEKSKGAAVIVMLSGDIFVEAANEIVRLRSEVAIVLQEASLEAGENPTQHQGLCVAHPTEAYRD